MKYWICKGEDGTFVYRGNQKPVFNLDEQKFDSVEEDWDWIELKYLDLFYILFYFLSTHFYSSLDFCFRC